MVLVGYWLVVICSLFPPQQVALTRRTNTTTSASKEVASDKKTTSQAIKDGDVCTPSSTIATYIYAVVEDGQILGPCSPCLQVPASQDTRSTFHSNTF
ncbi:hypothetical protein EYF80_065622 [Liparis tanakae]|uniref:Secreted protein n=1 Tax=Liparis tanakae TaxID=230148 RepID=A0A4Z2E649_9TELE|nr:hypothetical protein EYF80_065622 [Liparis tanakae]